MSWTGLFVSSPARLVDGKLAVSWETEKERMCVSKDLSFSVLSLNMNPECVLGSVSLAL